MRRCSRPRAPVATPLEWDELDANGFRTDAWTIADIPARIAERGDPWADMHRHGRSLPSRRDRLARLLASAR